MIKSIRKLVIIPAYNEGMNLPGTVNDIRENAPDFDILVINDGSVDDSEQILKSLRIKYLSHAVNLGIGGAVQSGYKYALKQDYDIAVQMDADGQHPSEYLSMMLDKFISEKSDMIIGSRYILNDGFQSTFMRRIGIRYFSWLICLITGVRITDPI